MSANLSSNETLTKLLKNLGIRDWNSTTKYIQNLPYGRTTNRHDLSLVLTEKKGSCSSKHAFLKTVAKENNLKSVRLLLGIYKMNAQNTPGIRDTLMRDALEYIPEAHCYLEIDGTRVDFTKHSSDFKLIENAIMEEIEIRPEQIASYKMAYHKAFLNKWREEQNVKMPFDALWNLREKCIKNLSHQKKPQL